MEQYFGVEHLRRDVRSDIGEVEEPDFARDLPSSVLPDLLRLALEHQQRVCFVRVPRRPVGNKPPDESPALGKYVADLKAWLEASGAIFHDDTGDPEMTLDLYEDGDHVDVLMMGGWLFFRETNADYLRTFLSLRPGTSSPAEREFGLHLFILAATWSLPLFINDAWALCRERSTTFNRWLESFGDGIVVTGAQAAAVGALATLTIVLRSQVTLDFIYFQF